MNTMTINGHKAVITYDPDTDNLTDRKSVV